MMSQTLGSFYTHCCWLACNLYLLLFSSSNPEILYHKRLACECSSWHVRRSQRSRSQGVSVLWGLQMQASCLPSWWAWRQGPLLPPHGLIFACRAEFPSLINCCLKQSFLRLSLQWVLLDTVTDEKIRRKPASSLLPLRLQCRPDASHSTNASMAAFFFKHWNVVDLQYCISCRCSHKVIQLYTKYIYFQILSHCRLLQDTEYICAFIVNPAYLLYVY